MGGLWVAAALAPAHAAPAAPERWVGLSTPLFLHHPSPEGGGGTSVAQDGLGFIWVGTQSGLTRWDGYRYRSFSADAQRPGTLPDSMVTALLTDEAGRLWVGTNAGGVARYDAAQDRFLPRPTHRPGRGPASITSLAGDGRGGLWIGTAAGLDHLDTRDDNARPQPVAAAPGLPQGSVQALLQDRGGALWVACEAGLVRRAVGSQIFVPVALPLPEGHPAVVTRLMEDRAGRVWLGTRAHGAFMIRPGGSQPEPVQESGSTPSLATDRVYSLVEATPGEVWIGTDGGGIVAVDTASGGTRRIRSQAGRVTGLADDSVQAMMRDRSGLVWVISNTAVSQHDPQQRAVLSLFGGGDGLADISTSDVPFVLPMPDGTVWLALGASGIDILDPMRGRIAHLKPEPGGLPKAQVLGMANGPGGLVALATIQGVYLMDPVSRKVRQVRVPQRDPFKPSWALMWDASTLWIGGEDGLWGVDLSDPNQPVQRMHLPAPVLGDARVVSLMRGRADELWVGTQRGLLRLSLTTGAAETVPADTADPVRLPAGFVSSLLTDARGRMWLSIYGRGVLLLEGQDADGKLRFRRIGLREGLPHLGVNKLLEDGQGRIWVSTDDGLAVIDPDSFAVQKLQRPQGVALLTGWTNAGAVTATGELIFGQQGGLSVVRPDEAVHWSYAAPVVVTDARVGTSPVPVGSLDPARPAASRIEVPPEVRALWVEFSALDYSAPEHNRYAHRLEGFDNDWIPTEATRRLASYTNLPPGHYVLQLRGSNRDGIWSDPLSIPVHVQAAWYQTTSFRAVCVLLGLSLIGVLVQARTVFLRRRQRELEMLVDERTAELQRRTEELHESQQQLEKIAYADPLTSLPNRRLFSDVLRRQVAQTIREGPPFALLLIDLDGFKQINDTLGHDAGDALLAETAARLLQAVREADMVARMGGDEFAVLLTQTSEREAVEAICRRIVASLAQPIQFNGHQLQVTASIGVALCPEQGVVPDALYKAADVALYAAKRGGRNTWRWHGQMSMG